MSTKSFTPVGVSVVSIAALLWLFGLAWRVEHLPSWGSTDSEKALVAHQAHVQEELQVLGRIGVLLDELSDPQFCGESVAYVKPGEWSWAKREETTRGRDRGFFSTISAYPYDTFECFRVKANSPVIR